MELPIAIVLISIFAILTFILWKHYTGILQSQNKFLAALRKLQKNALPTLEVIELSQVVVDTISEELGHMFGGIALITSDNNGLRPIAISKTQNEQSPLSQQVIPLTEEENLLVRAIKERRMFSTNNIGDIQKGAQNLLGIKNIFIYPLITKERILGILYYASLKETHLSKNESVIMEEFASEVARIIEVASLYQNLKVESGLISAERNKLEVALSGISDSVIAVDLNQKVTIFNSTAESLTGFSKAEAIGTPIDQLIKLFDKTKELVPFEYLTTFSKQDLKLIGKNGKESFVNLISGQISEGASVNLGCIITLHDVTREKELEEMKLDFVSMAAHELRTPLTSIRGYLSVFMQENSATLSGEQNMMLGRINTAASQLMGLIENLLNVSKIERGAFTVQFMPIDWPDTIRLVIEELKNRASERRQTLEFIEPSQVIPQIEADKLRVTEVLSNLISNAVSYTPEGGHITVWTEAKDNEVTTYVKDTGVGIPKEAIPHLFTKFFRISGNLEQGSKGTGLGLYISKSVVDMHHGKIWVDSELDNGSTFGFSLPVSQSKR